MNSFNSKPISNDSEIGANATDFVENLLEGSYFEMIGLRLEGVGRIIEAERALLVAKRLNFSLSLSSHIERIRYMRCRNMTSSNSFQARIDMTATAASPHPHAALQLPHARFTCMKE
jgi:hypothetical protein